MRIPEAETTAETVSQRGVEIMAEAASMRRVFSVAEVMIMVEIETMQEITGTSGTERTAEVDYMAEAAIMRRIICGVEMKSMEGMIAGQGSGHQQDQNTGTRGLLLKGKDQGPEPVGGQDQGQGQEIAAEGLATDEIQDQGPVQEEVSPVPEADQDPEMIFRARDQAPWSGNGI